MCPPDYQPRDHLAKSPFNAARQVVPAEPIPVGALVSHDQHGVGTVIALDGDSRVIIDFGHGVRMRVNLSSRRLERL